MPGALSSDDVWDQPGVTEGSAYDIPMAEYEAWAEANGIEVVLCDQNYQFDEIRRLRERGIRTVGRFVWEHFSAEHVEGAKSRVRRRLLVHPRRAGALRRDGDRQPLRHLGLPPGARRRRRRAAPLGGRARAGRLPRRLPRTTASRSSRCIEAFSRTTDERLRLLVKTQVERKQLQPVLEAAAEDRLAIEVLVEDEATADHLQRFAANDICIAPARWEGLGLPLYESMAFGMPVSSTTSRR